jgi:hypothetical protein
MKMHRITKPKFKKKDIMMFELCIVHLLGLDYNRHFPYDRIVIVIDNVYMILQTHVMNVVLNVVPFFNINMYFFLLFLPVSSGRKRHAGACWNVACVRSHTHTSNKPTTALK